MRILTVGRCCQVNRRRGQSQGECRVEQKLRNVLPLSLSASLGTGGGEWEGRKGHTASFFLLLNPLLFHNYFESLTAVYFA